VLTRSARIVDVDPVSGRALLLGDGAGRGHGTNRSRLGGLPDTPRRIDHRTEGCLTCWAREPSRPRGRASPGFRGPAARIPRRAAGPPLVSDSHESPDQFGLRVGPRTGPPAPSPFPLPPVHLDQDGRRDPAPRMPCPGFRCATSCRAGAEAGIAGVRVDAWLRCLRLGPVAPCPRSAEGVGVEVSR
jgi:hypothetical protein